MDHSVDKSTDMFITKVTKNTQSPIIEYIIGLFNFQMLINL